MAKLALAPPRKLEQLFEAAKRRRAYDGSDPEPCDISVVPRVVSPLQARALGEVCRPIVAASLARILDVHAGRDAVSNWSLDWITRSIKRLPAELFGNVRLDFLLEDGKPRLLEGGWVNLSAVDYAPQAALALLDIEPGLQDAFTVQRPAEGFRRRLMEQGVTRVAILVKEKRSIYSQHDWELIQEVLLPVESVVIAEQDFHSIHAGEGEIVIHGKRCDAVYLRALDGPAAFSGPHAATNRQTLAMLLESGVRFHDHPLTLLAEDKDLSWLLERDPSLAGVVPRTCRTTQVSRDDARRFVLKLRDLHSGEGVFLDEPEMLGHWDSPDAILQERIEPDRFPVLTVHGLSGDAVADLAVHVSYRYDVSRRELVTAEVAGYFSRFSLTSGKVNLCKGGGIVPVLCEREEDGAAAKSA